MKPMFFRLIGLVFFLSSAPAETAGDVLVVAPHPDDEVIGCAGVILRTLDAKKHVAVVVLTNGDGYAALAAAVAKKEREQLTPEDFMKAGALRQGHSVNAMKRLTVYLTEAHAVPSPDGKRVRWASDWDAPSGRPIGAYMAESYPLKRRRFFY